MLVNRRLECTDFLGETVVLLLLHLLHLLVLRLLHHLELLLQCAYLWIHIRLFCDQRLQVNAVHLCELRDDGRRIARQRLRIAQKLPDASFGRHALLRPIALVGPDRLVDGIQSLAVVRVLLLLLRDVALRFLVLVQPCFGSGPLFRVTGDLAESFLVLLAPRDGGFQRRKLRRNGVLR